MFCPKQPILVFIFVVNLLACLLTGSWAKSLNGRPEWPGIVIGFILLTMSFSNETDRKRNPVAYPGNTIWHVAGIRAVSLATFWGGLAISAHANESSVYFDGLAMGAVAVALSLGAAMYRRMRN